ncbi:MAG: YciI family protein [Sulfurovum sp.]|jgi:uncharacterized protein YciI
MQYLVIVYDYENSLDKRMEARPAHVEATQELMAQGKIISAVALIENEKMVGSSVVTNFDSEEEFDKWLENEPYNVSKVWDMENIQIVSCKAMPKK